MFRLKGGSPQSPTVVSLWRTHDFATTEYPGPTGILCGESGEAKYNVKNAWNPKHKNLDSIHSFFTNEEQAAGGNRRRSKIIVPI